MPHITAAISLTDGTAVARSFAPRKLGFGTGTFGYPRDALDVPYKQVTFSASFSESTPKRPTTRVQYDLTYPVIREVIVGDRQVVSIGRAKCEFVVPDDMLETEAQDMVSFMSALLSNASLKVGITKREPIWG